MSDELAQVLIVVGGVAYIVLAGWAIRRTWRRARPGGRRIVAVATVTSLFFGPGLVFGHGVGVAPWWLGILACVAQCRDVEAVGLVVHAVGAARR